MVIPKCFYYYLPFVILFQGIVVSTKIRNINTTAAAAVPLAIYVFGDSTVDPGNNNYIHGTPWKSNFPPYGKDFINHIPTGRFTNGRLVTDFAASYAGVKEYVPPYLDPNLSMEELITGVSFASAASGYDPLTAKMSGVISLSEQVDYFREYKTRIEGALGKERSEDLIKNGVYVISAGNNDFGLNYFGPLSFRRNSYSVTEYNKFLVQELQQFLQELMELGARKIVVVGTPPVGCLPVIISLSPRNSLKRQCDAKLCSAAIGFNQVVEEKLKEMQRINSKIYFVGIYDTFMNILQDPKKFGFEHVDTGCCGTGLLEVSCLCNPNSKVCSNVSEYVFFDSVHPTESTYYILFKTLIPTIDLILKQN